MAYDPNNLFARMVRGEIPCVKLHEDAQTLAFMDIMPQSEGHSLVIPKIAGENLLDTSPESATAALLTAQRVARATKTALNAAGVIVTQFNGAAAGQTIFHLHFHVIPVYAGAAMLKMHAREKADPERLEQQAVRIRAALASP